MNLTKFSERMTRKHGVKKLFRNEDVYKDEREKMETLVKDRRIDKSSRAEIKKVLDRGDLNVKRLVVDEKKSREYDKAIEYEMGKAIERGELPKPRIDSKMQHYLKVCRKNM